MFACAPHHAVKVTLKRLMKALCWVSELEVMADNYMAEKAKNLFGVPNADQNYYWSSNGTHMNWAMILGAAHDVTGNEDYKTGVVDLMDYIMGRNGLGRSYVTGYGDRPVERHHHRLLG